MDSPRIADLFWTVAQAAQAWRVSTVLALRWINQRRVQGAQYFNGRYFVPKDTAKPAPRKRRRKTATAEGRRVELHPEILAQFLVAQIRAHEGKRA